jgi:hypothetical protein
LIEAGADTDRAMEHFDRNFDGRVSAEELFTGLFVLMFLSFFVSWPLGRPVSTPSILRSGTLSVLRRVPVPNPDRLPVL